MSKVLISQARIGETGTIHKNKPGEQLGGAKPECGTFEIYGTFTECYRWKDASKGKAFAEFFRAAMESPHVGYSQTGTYPLQRRTGLKDELDRTGFDLSKIQDCNCDCWSGTNACLGKFTKRASDSITTATMGGYLLNTGLFTKLTINSMSTFKFQLGDILRREGHTATVTGGVEEPAYDRKMKSAYSLNVRTAPVDGTVIGIVHGGEGIKIKETWQMINWPSTKVSKTWHRIDFNGKDGWISGADQYWV